VAPRAHGGLIDTEEARDTRVSKTAALEAIQLVALEVRQGPAGQRFLAAHDVLDLHQVPGVDAGVPVDLLDAHADTEGVGDVPDPLGAGVDEFRDELVGRLRDPLRQMRFEPMEPTSRPRRAFCSDSWKLRPIAMTSPTDFICVVRRASAALNFSKAKRGTLVTT
jgi:hypothetical protein